MEVLSGKIHPLKDRKIKILQFGEGNFLRAFVDWIVQKMNNSGVFEGNVAVVQPLEMGRVKELAVQDGLYTLYLEGIDNKQVVSKREIIDVISGFNNPYEDYQGFLEYAKSPDLQIVISNTTEAGIMLRKGDVDLSICPQSYPAKLLALLLSRYNHFNGDKTKGLAIIPCELIDYNGTQLKKVMNELSAIIGLDNDFIKWLNECNHFTNTLVDRIVPGYPAADIEKIRSECGYIDNSLVKGEIFHLWVLEQNEFIQKVFPADKCGLDVIFAKDITPYKQRKVKILNGSHTALVPVAYLSGFDTVGESVNDAVIGKFLRTLIFDEINPTIDLPADQMTAFANSVLERYQNPFIRHELMSIALNSTTKFTTRLMPTLLDYIRIKKALPNKLLFSFAALILFHKGKRGNEDIALNDDKKLLDMWKDVWASYGNDFTGLVKAVAGWKDVWGVDMAQLDANLVKTVAAHLESISKNGMFEAVKKIT